VISSLNDPGRVVNVLSEDPDLAQDLCGRRWESARRDAEARLLLVESGEWSAPERAPAETGALRLLVLEGVLARGVSIGGRQGTELFGAGDLFLRQGDLSVMLPTEVRWWALGRARLALLDVRFINRMCRYPEVIDELIRRIERRSSAHALRFAIAQEPRLPTRLRLLLWQLADRFGRVHPEGVLLPLPLSHALLAELVGAQRPSVSRALKELEAVQAVARRPDGSWWLGRPPPEDGPV
jgi:CRP/FNR family transcriptional regulator, cyclic AMP receptor protein